MSDSRERAGAVSDACPHIGRLVACEECIAQAIEDARQAESEAIAEFVALRGSESGYTHVEDLVAAIRSRGAADPTSGEERGR